MDIKIHTYFPLTYLPLNTPHKIRNFSKHNVYKVVRTISGVGEHTTIAHLLTTLACSFNTPGLWCMAVQDPILKERRLRLLRGNDNVLVVMEKMRRRMMLWAFVKEDVVKGEFPFEKIQPLNFKKNEVFGNNGNTKLHKEAPNSNNECDLNIKSKNYWKSFNENVKENENKFNGNTKNRNDNINYTKHNGYHEKNKTKFGSNNSEKFNSDGKNYVGINEIIILNTSQTTAVNSLQYNIETNNQIINSDGNNSSPVKLSSGNQRNQRLLQSPSDNDFKGDNVKNKVRNYAFVDGKNLTEEKKSRSKLINQDIINETTSNGFDHYKIESKNNEFNQPNYNFVNNKSTDINNNRIEPIKKLKINHFILKNKKNIKIESKHEISKERPEIDSNTDRDFNDKNENKNYIPETINKSSNYKMYNGVDVTTNNTKTNNKPHNKTENTNNDKYDQRNNKEIKVNKIYGNTNEKKELIIDNREVAVKENKTDENKHNTITNNIVNEPDTITDNNKDTHADDKTKHITDNREHINISTNTNIIKETTTATNTTTNLDIKTDIHTATNTDIKIDNTTDIDTTTNTDIDTATNTDIDTDTQILSYDLQERIEKQRLCLSRIHVEIEKVLMEKKNEIKINEELEKEDKSLDEKLSEVMMVDWSEQRDILLKRTNQERIELKSVKESVQSAKKDLEEVKDNVEKLQTVVVEMEGQDAVIDKQCQKWNEICHKRQTEQHKSLSINQDSQ